MLPVSASSGKVLVEFLYVFFTYMYIFVLYCGMPLYVYSVVHFGVFLFLVKVNVIQL
jgi:hypothetical protein